MSSKASLPGPEVDKLHTKIGELTLVNNFLSQAPGRDRLASAGR